MGALGIVLGLTLCLAALASAASIKQKEGGSRCYDCNYNPAGGSPQPGYSHCALQSTLDASRVDKWQCSTGRCFVRRDPNGLVYRGCADPSILPRGVDTTTDKCQPQGPYGSIWSFCEGNLCNDGPMAAEGCSAGYSDAVNDVSQTDSTNYDVSRASKDEHGDRNDASDTYVLSNTDYRVRKPEAEKRGFRIPHGYGNTGYGIAIAAKPEPVEAMVRNQHDRYSLPNKPFAGLTNFRRFGLPRYAKQLSSLYKETDEAEELEQESEAARIETKKSYEENDDTHGGAEEPTPEDEYNPCDGKCLDNPSGLFADPSRPDRFIQCGVGYEGSQGCTCCKMFRVNCSGNTHFDDVTKVCVQSRMRYVVKSTL